MGIPRAQQAQAADAMTRRPWQVYREDVLDGIRDQPLSPTGTVPADLARRLRSETVFCMSGAQTRRRANVQARLSSVARAPNDNAQVQRLAVMQAAGTYAAFRQLPARERSSERNPTPTWTMPLFFFARPHGRAQTKALKASLR
jgi:hypothetical protein